MAWKKNEGIVRFYGAEMQTSEGWISLCQLPENRRYWKTREELWVELCLEGFLEWCNRELTPNSWLVIYEGFGISDAKIHKNEALVIDSASAWEKRIIEGIALDSPLAEIPKSDALYFMVPLSKRSGTTEFKHDKSEEGNNMR